MVLQNRQTRPVLTAGQLQSIFSDMLKGLDCVYVDAVEIEFSAIIDGAMLHVGAAADLAGEGRLVVERPVPLDLLRLLPAPGILAVLALAREALYGKLLAIMREKGL